MRPTDQETEARTRVVARLKSAIINCEPIPFPRLGETSSFSAGIGDYFYTFEGEDDLLHLQVERKDGGGLAQEEAQIVAEFVLQGVSSSLVWMRPGDSSHHFYVGHDDLLSAIQD